MPQDQAAVIATEGGDHRVVVRSIGDAPAGLIHCLRRVLPLDARRIAELLFRAPSAILGGLSREVADRIAGELAATGAEVAVLHADEPFEPGRGDREAALAPRRFDRLDEALHHVAALLGTDVEQGRALLCRDPCVLLSGISEATVDALRRRFEPLGIEVDESRPETARYDVLVGGPETAAAATLRRRLAGSGFELLPERDGAGRPQPLLAAGIDHAAAAAAWELARGAGVACQIVNRDFQRCDVVLERAADSAGLRAFLVERIGMPEGVVARALGGLPLVLCGGVRLAEGAELLAALHGLGAVASARLRHCLRFALRVERLGDGAGTDGILRWLGELTALERQRLLRSEHAVVEGPFTHTRARWLVHELARVGTVAHLVER